ncbi:uncharacterized protein A4U43_C06F14440 [Asparagus officinalis]|uniref:chloroplast protein-transporting ATPase n=1 Tax=Asparagus officinalis TaxID=4686 RepID=A0A5P1ELX5_ASPOF|nr:uncharacterized protein A4U43_C06F14440 [Asparagus officinalis]
MIDVWETEEWKTKSYKAKESRSKLPYNHISGSRSFAAAMSLILDLLSTAYLNALTGNGVHVVTVNDYLAQCDAEWMGQIHRFLGLSVGLIQRGMDAAERRSNYNCDITYTNNSLHNRS